MSVRYALASQAIHELLYKVIDKHHQSLSGSEIKVVFRLADNWQSKGREILGKTQVVPALYRTLFGVDAVIILNNTQWGLYLNDKQKLYLLDHELAHIEAKVNSDGEYVYDDVDRRVLLTTAQHDIEDFMSVVKRHGLITNDLRKFVRVMSESEQLSLFDYLKEDEQGKKVIQMVAGENGEERTA